MTTEAELLQTPPPAATMMQIICNPVLSRALTVAASLGIADLVQDQPRTADELAASIATHGPSLYRILRALASVGIFFEDATGRFRLTPLADCLRTEAPGSLRDWACYFLGAKFHWDAWGHIQHSVRTGQPAFDHVYGMDAFAYFGQSPADAALFNNAMTTISQSVSAAVVGTYDFSAFDTLADVGGGHGRLLTAILQANPPLRGILFELPSVIAGAGEQIVAAGLTARCRLEGGDFFQSAPRADACILKSVIHDWDDARAGAILKNIRHAIPPHGKLLLVELVVPPGNQASLAKLIDLEMLVMTHGGRERTESEFHTLFEAAGFSLTRVIPTPSPLCIIEAVPA